MSESWAGRVAEARGITLAPSLRSWFDDALWARRGVGAFASALAPQQLIDLTDEVVWPGFLPPDLLPIIGNDYGDWLCLRIGLSGDVSEIVYWNHGGGDWIPFGPNLPEALLYAASLKSEGEAESSEAGSSESGSSEAETKEKDGSWPQWAAEQFAKQGGAKVLPFCEKESKVDALSALIEAGAAQTPVGRDLCLRLLRRPALDGVERERASELGAPWEPEFVRWLFDSALAPNWLREKLFASGEGEAGAIEQDWTGAEMEALRIERVRPNLGWPMDLAGWAAERRGDLQQAIPRYRASLSASTFSDESVRFRTLWFSEGFGKFSAARLWELRDSLTAEEQADPYLRLFWENDGPTLRQRVSRFWLARAEKAVAKEEWGAAWEHYLRAGWDVGMPRRSDYLEVLRGLHLAAEKLGATALARLTAIHLQLLETRIA